MSTRQGIEVTYVVLVQSGEPPTTYIDRVTAQIRLHFPPHTASYAVHRALSEAVREAADRIDLEVRGGG